MARPDLIDEVEENADAICMTPLLGEYKGMVGGYSLGQRSKSVKWNTVWQKEGVQRRLETNWSVFYGFQQAKGAEQVPNADVAK
uniref:ABC transporter substrate-binding protein n=1 Tax=Steinernema glaseri TaxID=37863 RepID=A0A1I7ZV44_9BILA